MTHTAPTMRQRYKPALQPARIVHADELARRQAHQRHDAGRESPSQRGYDWRWQTRTRPAQMQAEPWCRMCMAAGRGPIEATEVDHITPLADGGTHAADNLQSLCHRCHNAKTAQDKGRRGRGQRGGGHLKAAPCGPVPTPARGV